MNIEVAIELTSDEGEPIAFKFSSSVFELNVRVPQNELSLLDRAAETTWEDGSILAGESAGASVFWCAGPGSVSIMVGHDDETWDFGIEVPVAAWAEALRQARNLVHGSST